MKKSILINQSSQISYDFDRHEAESINVSLREKLLAGIAHFAFQKKDGSMREAYGTLHPDKIIIPAGQKANENPTIGTYFDIEAGAWRSYTVANLIAIY